LLVFCRYLKFSNPTKRLCKEYKYSTIDMTAFSKSLAGI
jgi:hypothetical protein